jgi:hypothetical protein
MFVWFKPFQRQRKADRPPHAKRANHGRVQKKKAQVEHLLTPCGNNGESITRPPEI